MTESETTESSEPPGGRPPDAVLRASVDLADPQHRLADVPRAWLRDEVARALVLLRSSGEVRVRIVGDSEMAEAHQEYLGQVGTTDVITFDMSDDEEMPDSGSVSVAGVPGRHLDTDILICIDEASRQASSRGHTVEQELLLYVVHGLLHCLGHDDHDADAAARMHEAEDRVLSALGVGATYSRPAAPPSERESS